MANAKIHLILLSGGSGTRLWPLSNNARSKQFLKVLRDSEGNHVSMVQRVFSQISQVQANTDITIATSESQKDIIKTQISGLYNLVLEPERRDTAPAIMLACSYLSSQQKADLDDTVIVMPIDTFANQEYYDRIVDIDKAVQTNRYELVLLGVEPTYPSAKYGYIIPQNRNGKVWPVASFKEKPTEEIAQTFIDQGALWNCGVFAFKLGYLLSKITVYCKAQDYEEMANNYSVFPKISFDYEVVEKATSVAVVSYKGIWKDLGTWNTLCEEMAEQSSGRAVVDQKTCHNVHVVNETALPMVVAGLSDVVVVATPDGILATSKEASTNIKGYVSQVAESRPMYEQRIWGEYRVLDSGLYPDNQRSLTKELIVKAGAQISYQKHLRRSEVWTVVSGCGEVVVDGEVQSIEPGSVVCIKPTHLHAVLAHSELHIIEVQQGDLLVEEDIERFGYYWGSN